MASFTTGFTSEEIQRANEIMAIRRQRANAWRGFDKAEDELKYLKKYLNKINQALKLLERFRENPTPKIERELNTPEMIDHIATLISESKVIQLKIKHIERALTTAYDIPAPLAKCNYISENTCNDNILCYWDDGECYPKVPHYGAKRGLIPGKRIEGDRFLITPRFMDDLTPDDKRLFGQYKWWLRAKTLKEQRENENDDENDHENDDENSDTEEVREVDTDKIIEQTLEQIRKWGADPRRDELEDMLDGEMNPISSNPGSIGGRKNKKKSRKKKKKKKKKRKTIKKKKLIRKKAMKKRKTKKRRSR